MCLGSPARGQRQGVGRVQVLEMGGEVIAAQNWERMEGGEAWASPWQGREGKGVKCRTERAEWTCGVGLKWDMVASPPGAV